MRAVGLDGEKRQQRAFSVGAKRDAVFVERYVKRSQQVQCKLRHRFNYTPAHPCARAKIRGFLTNGEQNTARTVWERFGNARFLYWTQNGGATAMEQTKRGENYDSYLLRIWRGGEQNQWRWLLQNIRTGEQKGFSDLDALTRFLEHTYRTFDTFTPDFPFRDEREG
jgi:hypothetical protein